MSAPLCTKVASTRPWPRGNPRQYPLVFKTIKETEEWLADHPDYYD